MTGTLKTMQPCANPACTAVCAIEHLACLKCWMRLPQQLRTAINCTYRNREHQAYAENVQEARRLWAAP